MHSVNWGMGILFILLGLLIGGGPWLLVKILAVKAHNTDVVWNQSAIGLAMVSMIGGLFFFGGILGLLLRW